MLYKYYYKNKKRYNFNERKNFIFAWEKSNKVEKNNFYNKRGNLTWQNKLGHKFINQSLNLYHNYLNYYKLQESNYKDWTYKTKGLWKKRPFYINITNRFKFFKKITKCLEKGDDLQFIRNSLYSLYEKTSGLHKNLNVLNFYWLYNHKKKRRKFIKKKKKAKLLNLGVKSFFLGFLKKGLKRQCETRFFTLLILLKKKLHSAGLQIMHFFIKKLWPLVGFRRQRLNKRAGKKKSLSFFYKLNRHNLRWKALLFRRFCLNSPFYQRKAQFVSVTEIYNALIQAIHSRGPIVKCLNVYYRLIKKRTPNDKNKKKKKSR